MASTIFNLGGVAVLKNILRFKSSDVQIITGNSADPLVTAVDAVAGSIYIRANGEVYIKNTSGSNTDFRQISSQAALDAHINDVADAHDASAISNIPSGNLAATDVQAALNELQSDIDTRATQTALNDHINDTVDAHDASAISNVPAGNLAATDVQAALNELQSDIDTRALDADVIKKDGSVAFTAAQSMGGFKLTSLANGTAASDAVNKGQLDAALEGLKPKAAARVATTANITIATDLNAGDVIDGITLANGDRVLVKDQSSAAQNGIYVVSATPTRSTDFDSLSPIDEINGSLVAIQEGTVNAGKVFVQSGTVAILDTDPINFVFFNSSSSLVGGDGITVSGSNISVDHDGQGLQFVATQLALELDGATLSKSSAGLKLGNTAVSPGTFGSATQVASFTVDQQGRLTDAQDIQILITDANVDAAAGISPTKIGNGDVDSTEFSYLNGVTSSIQTQLNAKASTTLNNLGTTSINANLLPNATGTLNLGSPSLAWQQLTTNNIVGTNLSLFNSIGGTARAILDATTPRTLASGDVSEFTIWSPNLTATDIGIQAGDPASGPTGSVFVSTGNASLNNNSGSIRLYTGTVSGTGVRGTIDFRDASLAAASVGYVWSLANATTGAGNWVAAPAGYTDEQAQDAVGNILVDSSKIDFTYSDATPSITATIVAGSLVDADINAAAAIALTKLAAVTANRALQSDASGFVSASAVTSTELGYVAGVTSAIQTQLNDKHAKGATDFVFASNASLTANTSNEVITGLTFAHASYNACKIEYRVKKGTLVRTGTILVSTDGTAVAFNDMFVETVDSTLVFEAVVNGANINIRQTNAETGTINITFEQTLFPV